MDAFQASQSMRHAKPSLNSGPFSKPFQFAAEDPG